MNNDMAQCEGKIIVSACLAGIPCNYKGEAKPHPKVVKLVEEGKAIPVCPECLGGLPTPRPAAERQVEKVITIDGTDATVQFNTGAEKILQIARDNACRLAILKARSPSCGKGKIYDGTFTGTLIEGNGVTAQLLIKNGIEVKTEEDL